MIVGWDSAFILEVLEPDNSVITMAECSQLGEYTFNEISWSLALISLRMIFNKTN